MKVLLIEDDLNFGESLREYLEINDIKTKWLSDDREVEVTFLTESFDVIILDLILKYEKGEDILKKLRAKGIKTPILVLTAKKQIKDKETCFERGADDYLTKPFSPRELVLRLNALTRRERPELPIVYLDDLKIDLEKETIYKGDKEIKPTPKAWQILSLLIKHRYKVVSKEQILNYVWGVNPVGEEIIRTYIKELRKILPHGSIETYKGRGYRFK
jgi:DNA-binding response OmpR family regulator